METLLSDLYDTETEEDRTFRRNKERTVKELWESGEPEDTCGETRCLTEAEYEPVLRLVSMVRSQYPDIELTKEKVIIGKKREQADICLKQDCVSRIHARLERQGDGYYLTDLNSMNGTFVNGERLRPNEKRQIYAGDKISFASLRYTVK